MDLSLILAFGPAAFFGAATIALAASAMSIAKKPVPEGAPPRTGLETTLVIATFLAGILCIVCVIVAFAYVNAQGIFTEAGEQGLD